MLMIDDFKIVFDLRSSLRLTLNLAIFSYKTIITEVPCDSQNAIFVLSNYKRYERFESEKETFSLFYLINCNLN